MDLLNCETGNKFTLIVRLHICFNSHSQNSRKYAYLLCTVNRIHVTQVKSNTILIIVCYCFTFFTFSLALSLSMFMCTFAWLWLQIPMLLCN